MFTCSTDLSQYNVIIRIVFYCILKQCTLFKSNDVTYTEISKNRAFLKNFKSRSELLFRVYRSICRNSFIL